MRPDLLEKVPLTAPASPVGGHSATPLRLVPLATDLLSGEILEGWLVGAEEERFPIIDGVPILVQDPGAYVAARPHLWNIGSIASSDLRDWLNSLQAAPTSDKYDSPRILGEYVWAHYDSDRPHEPDPLYFANPEALAQSNNLTSFFRPVLDQVRATPDALLVDLGCNVGRMTFEAAAKVGFALGIDFSWGSIQVARTLLRDGYFMYPRRIEGHLATRVRVEPPAPRNLEFIVADAAMPYLPKGCAIQIIAMHLLDRLPDPRGALGAMADLLTREGRLILTDPFSWDATYTPEHYWLGGVERGLFPGSGLDNLMRILRQLGFLVAQHAGEVTLTLRETARFCQKSYGALIVADKCHATVPPQ